MTTKKGKNMEHILALVEDENRMWMTVSEELENVVKEKAKITNSTFEEAFNNFLQEALESYERDMCMGFDGSIANIEVPE